MKKLTSLILTICMLSALFAPLSVLPAAATSGTTGDCTWTLDGTKLTISGKGEMANYDYDYNNGQSSAPWGTDITSVVMEDGVTSIGWYAFSGCTGLTSVTIPNSVTSIGVDAFYGCTGLTSITIPESVTTMGGLAFGYCTALETVNFNAVNFSRSYKYDGTTPFCGCTKLEKIAIGEKVKNLTSALFADCTAIKTIAIPSSVEKIEWGLFASCWGLNTVTIYGSPAIAIGGFPQQLITFYGYAGTSVEKYAASYANFTFVDLNAEPEKEIVPGDCDGDGKVSMNDLTLLAKYLAGHDVTLG